MAPAPSTTFLTVRVCIEGIGRGACRWTAWRRYGRRLSGPLSGSHGRFPFQDRGPEQGGQSWLSGVGKGANLDMAKPFSRAFQQARRVFEGDAVIEAEIYVMGLWCDIGVMLRHLLRANAVARDALFRP